MPKPPQPITTAHVQLPWPEKALWQNRKVHWSERSKATARARQNAAYEALDAGLKRMPKGEGWEHHLSFDFCPPDRRKRDLQNLPATMKGHIDGIADALGVDDGTFKVLWPTEFGTVADNGGSVLVVVRAIRATVGADT